MIFFVGGPGSGKSHVIENFYLPGGGFALVDSDAIAQDIYCALDEDRNAVAKAVADHMIENLIKAKVPLIVHATGANFEKCERWFPAAKAAGYWTVLVWVKCPQEVAKARNGHRQRNLGTIYFEER